MMRRKLAETVIWLSLAAAGCSNTNWVGRQDEGCLYRASRKLARGTVNVITAPAEVINQPIRLAEVESGFVPRLAGAVAGIPVGVVYCGWRIGAGVFDFVTAPFLAPQKAIVSPEFIAWARSLEGGIDLYTGSEEEKPQRPRNAKD